MFFYGIIFSLLICGFMMLFQKLRRLEVMSRLLKQTLAEVDEATRKRLLEDRRGLLQIQREYSVWYRAEQQLNYSGLKRKYSFLTAENWLLGNVLICAMIFLIVLICAKNLTAAFILVSVFLVAEHVLLETKKALEMRAVNENLIKFLNFLGNYSITAGEITGILRQISKYMEEPIQGVLLQCCYEAQITGDASLALLSMAEKVEHPKFKELVRNMEIGLRYSADFTVLVNTSRRSLREYQRLSGERKGMLREAIFSMLLLLGMSLFALITVDRLIEASIWEILWHTMPGRIAVAVLAVILGLMLRQLYRLNG